jgi:hypothetical protein
VGEKTDATRAREETAKLRAARHEQRKAAWTEARETIKKIAAKDADQYMLRLPPGLRDRVARRAAENGRSMNTEIVEAIERHLTGADRVTQLWEFFGKHQENIEAIRWILPAIRLIENYLDDVQAALSSLERGTGFEVDPGRPPGVANTWAARPDTDLARLPLITADEVQIIKALLKETGDEETFLAILGTPRIEDIRGFERAMEVLGKLMKDRTHDEKQTIMALLKGSSRGEEFLAAMGRRGGWLLRE